MATSDTSRMAAGGPDDLLPALKRSGVVSERVFEEIRKKVLDGAYPFDARGLAERLVRDRILTEYQAKRLLTHRDQGLVVGRYVVLDRIGSGSMGRVYKAHHQMMDRVVALKIIAPEIVSNEKVVSRFQREMKLVGRLDHPNVVRAFDAGHVGSTLFIAMEYVSGSSLGQKFRSEGPLPPLDVTRYAAQAARGLAHAHDQAIVHRDIKPSNLLLSNAGQVKVLDLGLGVLTEADEAATFATADGIAVGTIDYMSPEQACGKDVDGRSDLYSLGCSMYHLISGRMPFPGASPVERLGKRINGRPAPIRDIQPDVPSRVAQVLDQMLQPKLGDRFASATAAAEALEAAVRPRSTQATKKAATPPPPPPHPDEAAVPAQALLATPAPPEPQTVATRVRYPGWFRPLASLAETAPMAALAVMAAVVLLSFAAGVGAAVLLGR